MRIGVDLLWVRPGICGGTESFIRNLLHGFGQYDLKNEYILFTTKDNHTTFAEYSKYSQMKIEICNVECKRQPIRILWENLFLDRKARKMGVDVMFIPVYSKPHSGKKIPYVTVIHDLQALHYPQYFSKGRYMFLKHAWKASCKNSAKVITISSYCMEDLISHYPFVEDKIQTIYNPICKEKDAATEQAEPTNNEEVAQQTIQNQKCLAKYSIIPGAYDYCVSSLLPHKNLETILKYLSFCRKNGNPQTLVLSGVGGNIEEFQQKIKEYGIEGDIIQTGFVSNEERDALYQNARLFLFPSVYEGFGMPPIEAMSFGKRVVMTKECCLYEVTEGKATYVKDPFDEKAWQEAVSEALTKEEKVESFPQYQLENVTKQYIQALEGAKSV